MSLASNTFYEHDHFICFVALDLNSITVSVLVSVTLQI